MSPEEAPLLGGGRRFQTRKTQVLWVGLLSLGLVAVGWHWSSQGVNGPVEELAMFKISSANISNGVWDAGLGCDTNGNDWHTKSPQVSWFSAPPGTSEFTLKVQDLGSLAAGYQTEDQGKTHWIVIQIPVGETTLAPGASGTAKMHGVEQTNSFGQTTWAGFCPPHPPHKYRITVEAVSQGTAIGSAHIDATFCRGAC
mmetsp:Transcript_27699/g.65679  ORF Transcript_27699/g.65679 Transcript_27699/m.65679 type:complete len:198 (+) Transcript_27699:39-632(+)